MKKKLTAIALVVAMLAIAVVGGSLAYFTDDDEAINTFTVGNVKIELTETKWNEQGIKDAPDVYPGEALAKNPVVKNNGANPCFVRVKVTGLDCLKDVGASDIIYRTGFVDNKLGNDWVDGKDGYFYYNKVLGVEEETTALFDQIVIPADLENLDEDVVNEFSVNVVAEAVQAQGAKPSFAAVEEMSVKEIQDWFATCMPAQP